MVAPFKKDSHNNQQQNQQNQQTASTLDCDNINKINKGSGCDNKILTLKEQCEYMNRTMTDNQKETGITLIHFNDVYNVDCSTTTEPIGGATRFSTAIRSFNHLEPLVLFSGDAFSPSSRKCLFLIIVYYRFPQSKTRCQSTLLCLFSF